MGIFASKKIKSPIQRVKFLGMRTAQETLIFTTVNFTVYSFWIEYENGSSETLEISPQNPNDKSGKEQKLFDELMPYVNAEDSKTNMPHLDSSNILDELKNLKELLDVGVIPEDIYEQKKVSLLEELSSLGEPASDGHEYNVLIIRENEHSKGEANTYVYVDGNRQDADLDDSVSLKLSPGKHVIYFQRAALKSRKMEFEVLAFKKYKVRVATKTFSIDARIEELI